MIHPNIRATIAIPPIPIAAIAVLDHSFYNNLSLKYKKIFKLVK
jgi:hypothetical protein